MGDAIGSSEGTAAAVSPLGPEELGLIDAYWRAANYLSVGQIYLLDNPLLREPLRAGARQAAPARPLGHDPGPQLRLRAHEPGDPQLGPRRDLRDGPGARRPGGGRERLPRGHLQRGLPARDPGRGRAARAVPAVLVPGRDPLARRARDARVDPRGRRARLRACRTPTAPPSTTPTCSSCCIVGDGEAETGPLATGWHSNKFLNPVTDGAVLPILHLNGYKIANPTVLARIGDDELTSLLEGYGHTRPLGRRATSPAAMHQRMAAVLDRVVAGDRRDPARGPRSAARRSGRAGR